MAGDGTEGVEDEHFSCVWDRVQFTARCMKTWMCLCVYYIAIVQAFVHTCILQYHVCMRVRGKKESKKTLTCQSAELLCVWCFERARFGERVWNGALVVGIEDD